MGSNPTLGTNDYYYERKICSLVSCSNATTRHMKSKKIVETTTNRGEFNRVYKFHLEQKGRIRCSYCAYHCGENSSSKPYGGRKKDDEYDIRYPNWKLVSKNKKQWMKKPIKIVEENRIQHRATYVQIKF